MALPWLESLHAYADTPGAAAFPKRFAVMFLGNGINEDHWSASGQGAEMKLSKTLEPLESLKTKINVVDGLFNKAATGQGIHPAQTGCLLTGTKITKGAIILEVNGAVKQKADLSFMIWSVAEQISKLSEAFELVAGDIIYSGTPENVGPVVKGDVMLCKIEKLPDMSVKIV